MQSNANINETNNIQERLLSFIENRNIDEIKKLLATLTFDEKVQIAPILRKWFEETKTKKVIFAPEHFENNVFAVELCFVSFCTLISIEEPNSDDTEVFLMLKYYYLNNSWLTNHPACLKKIVDFYLENEKNISIKYCFAICELILESYDKEYFDKSLSVEQRKDCILMLAELYHKIGVKITNAGEINASLFKASNTCIDTILSQELLLIDATLKKRLTIIKSINTTYLDKITSFNNFMIEQTIHQFLARLRQEFTTLQASLPNLFKRNQFSVVNVMQNYIKIAEDGNRIWIDDIELGRRYPKEKFLIACENIILLFKLSKATNHKGDINGIKNILSYFIRFLLATDFTTIDSNIVTNAIIDLIPCLIESEELYLNLSTAEERETFGLNSLVLIDEFKLKYIKPKERSRLDKPMFESYKQCWKIKAAFPDILPYPIVSMVSLANYHDIYNEKDMAAKIYLQIIDLILTGKHADDAGYLPPIFSSLMRLNTPFLQNYDENSVPILDKLLTAATASIEHNKSLPISKELKIKGFDAVFTTLTHQIEHLIAKKLYTHAIKYSLKFIDMIYTIHDKKYATSLFKIIQSTFQSSAKLIKPLLEENILTPNPSKLDDATSVIFEILTYCLRSDKTLILLPDIIDTICNQIPLLQQLNHEEIFLNNLIELLKPSANAIEAVDHALLPNLKLTYLAVLIKQQDMLMSRVDNILDLIEDCQTYYFSKKKMVTNSEAMEDCNYEEILLKANERMAICFIKDKQFQCALNAYNNIIELAVTLPKEQSEAILAKSVLEANEIIFTLIEQHIKTNELSSAINLCDEILENCELHPNEQQKSTALKIQITLGIQLSELWMHGLKFTDAIAWCDQAKHKVGENMSPEILANLATLREQAVHGLVTQSHGILNEVKQLLANKQLTEAIKLCKKAISKLSFAANAKDCNRLKADLEAVLKRAEDTLAIDEKYAFSTAVSLSKNKQATLFAADANNNSKEKAKNSKPAKPQKAPNQPEQRDTMPNNPINNNNNINNSSSTDPLAKTTYEGGKIGQIVTAPYLSKENTNIRTLLMKNIKGFKELKRDNLVLYKELKRVVLEGGSCRKHGQSGIKYLPNVGGIWEAKVINTRSRLFGHTETINGVNYAVFDVFSKIALHRSK